jgi:hypothetical protein
MVGAALPGDSTAQLLQFEVPEPSFRQVLLRSGARSRMFGHHEARATAVRATRRWGRIVFLGEGQM